MKHDLDEAVRLLQHGELVAFPTETVYGLGADAANPDAVGKIFAAKGRPADHPLIVHLAGADYLEQWAEDIPQVAWDMAEAFWPGPLTLILKRAAGVPYAVTGGQETVGIRVPAHPLTLELLRAYAQAGGGQGGMSGIAGPSANRFGRISPTEAAHVRDELGAAVAMVLDGGPCRVGIESTIVDLSVANAAPRILRPGHITPEQIARVVGELPTLPGTKKSAAVPRVSGSLDGHYAPRTPTRLVNAADMERLLDEFRHRGLRCGVLAHTPGSGPDESLRLPNEPQGYARGLYTALRELDKARFDAILVETIPSDSDWAAVADRLRRAANGSGALPSSTQTGKTDS